LAGIVGGSFFHAVDERNQKWRKAISDYMSFNECRRAYPTEQKEWVYDCHGEKYLFSEIERKTMPALK
jgi:hypothetical protein